MKRNRWIIFIPAFLFILFNPSYAQEISISTNAVEWATTTPNISAGIALDKKLTLHLDLANNPWQFGAKEENKKIKHWLIQPELRKWLYEKYDGHFFGVHTQFIRYNIGGIKLPLGIFRDTREYRFDGYGVGSV